jgi:hypothetical protein
MAASIQKRGGRGWRWLGAQGKNKWRIREEYEENMRRIRGEQASNAVAAGRREAGSAGMGRMGQR